MAFLQHLDVCLLGVGYRSVGHDLFALVTFFAHLLDFHGVIIDRSLHLMD